MIGRPSSKRRFKGTVCASCVLAVICVVAGCEQTDDGKVQGYVEGEYVYVSSPVAGTLTTLSVRRGDSVTAGQSLFELESSPQTAVRDEAGQRLAQARASLEDLTKGKRPSEIEAIAAQLQQARAAGDLTEKEFFRQEGLIRDGATTPQEFDRARSVRDQAREQVAQLEAELKTAELGARSDQIAAAQANVRALEASLARAEWELSQTRQTSPQTGLVFDTLFRPGEWVGAGKPVVMLLPPANIKVRAFVSETRVGVIHAGDEVRVAVDGVPEPVVGHVSFISPKAEYTPPVIYSRSNRSKLVFMVEAVFDPNTAAGLHPGQPVDVEFGS